MNVAIIPARWDSTRFPGKPLHEIAGKPLLRRVWEQCLRARKLDNVVIATDDMRIAEAAFAWGAEVALTSPKQPTGTDRIAEVAKGATNFSRIVNVQGDEPFIEPRLIDRLIAVLEKNPKVGLVTAAHPFSDRAEAESAHQVKVVIDRRGRALYFSRALIPLPRRDAASAKSSAPKWLRHQGIYAFRRQTLLEFVRWKPSPLERAEGLEQLRALENGVTVNVLITKHGSPGIDTPADARNAERILLQANSKRRAR